VTIEHRVDSFWHRLSDAERTALADVARPRRYDKGATLIRAADTERWAAILHSGQVSVVGADGARAIAIRSAGDIVGEQALIDRRARSASVLADTSVRALVIGGNEFDRVLDHHPRILRVLCAVVSERLREADRNLSEQSDDSFTKVVEFLVRYADAHRTGADAAVCVRIGSQAKLGTVLGISRESVVRALHQLRDNGMVTTDRGSVTIRDLEALYALAAR
jgi:CRP-like cAMP-binding protein